MHCDHHIPLLNPQLIVKVGSYRYPFHHKNKIEKQGQEMLQSGAIRPSNSPFASSVVFVKKTYSNWRLCVDYRSLNQNTIKDKFPIRLIVHLLDELHEASFFSKLDLRSGYHQVKVVEEDNGKIPL